VTPSDLRSSAVKVEKGTLAACLLPAAQFKGVVATSLLPTQSASGAICYVRFTRHAAFARTAYDIARNRTYPDCGHHSGVHLVEPT
jgi:hypothetical protein